jgi:hypothetical protein
METVIVNECIVDGCYRKHMKGKGMCKDHQDMYDRGLCLSVNYGQKVKKTLFNDENKGD